MSLIIFILLIILIFLIIYLLIKNAYTRPENFPPGPPRLPIWGSYWILLALNYKFPHLALRELGKRYKTNVLGFYLGQTPAVITLNYETTHEMLTRSEFTNRQVNFVIKKRAFGQENLGIFFSYGDFWKEQRRYSLRTMRDFGLGRRSPNLENVVADEVKKLMTMICNGPSNEIEKTVCKEKFHILLPHGLFSGFFNAFWYVLTGDTYSDPYKSHKVFQNALKFQRSGEPLGGALVYTPWLRYIWPNKSGHVPTFESHFELVDFFKDYIKEIKENLSEDHSTGYIHEYLLELKKQNPETYSTFSEDQLLLTLVDHLIPSIVANTTVLAFTFLRILHNPHVQTKIQQEIDTVVGSGRYPTLDDRSKMIYTEATIKEGLRMDALNPLGIPRECNQDTYFQGYFIPKGTFMVPGNHSSNMDTKLWGDPENFRPERFIDTNGHLVKKDYALLFGAGKRVCVGETFSRQNMFLFLSMLMQNFQFSVPDGESLPETTYQNYINGINVAPKEFWIYAKPRF
uniref:Cytochrome P450 CYP304V1 n=1 Tax=Chrysoperla zastrowi sillemi TaxID=482137 RepID=A0A9E8C0L7_9NEOP|nr:cytochrome P450 CYP304V1 [Chrysoperla zastrowi sillemi]